MTSLISTFVTAFVVMAGAVLGVVGVLSWFLTHPVDDTATPPNHRK